MKDFIILRCFKPKEQLKEMPGQKWNTTLTWLPSYLLVFPALTSIQHGHFLFPNLLNSEIQVNLSYQGFKEWVIRDSYVHNSWEITY